MKNPKIQHAAVMSQRPKCLGCGQPLKPCYTTKTERYRSLLTSKTDPSEGRDYGWTFEPALNQWSKVIWKDRVLSRTWDGTYGDMGEGLFCGTRCGYRYGRAVGRQVQARDEQIDHQQRRKHA